MTEAPRTAANRDGAANQPITDAVYGKKGKPRTPSAPREERKGYRTFAIGSQLRQKLGYEEYERLLARVGSKRRTK